MKKRKRSNQNIHFFLVQINTLFVCYLKKDIDFCFLNKEKKKKEKKGIFVRSLGAEKDFRRDFLKLTCSGVHVQFS